MGSKKKRIVIPTEADVSAYGGPDANDPAAPQEQSAAGDDSPRAGSPESNAATENGLSQEAPTPEEAEQWKDKYLRARAELQNYQRRSERDRADALKYAHAGLVKALIPVLDDLERVVASGADGGDSSQETIIDGVRLTLENCRKTLRDFGVHPIEAEGQPFDPERHEAMMMQPSAEHAEPTVLQEVAKGYRLHERVLRPAKVIVSRPADADETGG